MWRRVLWVDQQQRRRAVMDIRRLLLAAGTVAISLAPCVPLAQKVEKLEFKTEPGDKVVFRWTLGNKAQNIEEVITASTDTEMRAAVTVGGKAFEGVVTKNPFTMTSWMCLANGQPCKFSPGLLLLDLPLEKGKKWSTAFTVTGDTFTAEVTQERKVEGFEKVRVAAGEFDAVKVSFSGRVASRDQKGNVYTGKEDGTEWWATATQRPIAVKVNYRNSFGEKFSLEAVSASLR
jgi:hypothetical protein